ncbi:hypothetical protein RG58_25795 (plasmid) [Escherichia coli]|nr:hypothetical protein RG56_25835 [Escherichia coli]APL16475.1 hypothetical protein RG58_25795 [Escherichia coli]APL26110.1 hypothetical protein RG60_25660 [Escherichia coli]APL31100.1 hypothetical protein RG61_25700 [Escherichia coli]APL40955.1 hypothetical protein RG63_25470 [Escherichia coli]
MTLRLKKAFNYFENEDVRDIFRNIFRDSLTGCSLITLIVTTIAYAFKLNDEIKYFILFISSPGALVVLIWMLYCLHYSFERLLNTKSYITKGFSALWVILLQIIISYVVIKLLTNTVCL